jgi:hypothetical protein
MCGEFERTFPSYEVKDIVWPVLLPDELARLRGMPFWGEALETELIASQCIQLMVETEAIRSCATRSRCRTYEESRHAELFASLMKHYAIAVPDLDGYTPRDPEWVSCGWEWRGVRYLFAFGLFKLAAELAAFRTRIRRYLKKLISEEAPHHFLFQLCDAWSRQRGPHYQPWFSIRRAAALAVQAFGRARTALRIAPEPTSKRRTISLSRPRPSWSMKISRCVNLLRPASRKTNAACRCLTPDSRAQPCCRK